MTRSCKFSFGVITLVAAVLMAATIGSNAAFARTASSPPMLFAMQDLGDNDHDGLPNYLDPDDDNDGVVDDEDYAPFDPLIWSAPSVGDPSPTPVTDGTTPSDETGSSSDQSAVVTGLPETGVGHTNVTKYMVPLYASMVVGILAFTTIEKRFRSR